MPRGARLDSPGTLHHVIVRGIEKRKIVDDENDRQNFIGRMGQVAQETHTAIYAWVLMRNHSHILLRSGPNGISCFMSRLLTGYAISYNQRHRRHGHLFQNRYKSIICEEDIYFKELVRYIHLNPLRARVIETLSQLDSYPWSGHSVIAGRQFNTWQDHEYVLKWFGDSQSSAKKAYRVFIQKGIQKGRRPELVGGGLIRSMGGWSVVKSMRRDGLKAKGDERILGSSDFVLQLIDQAEERVKNQFSGDELLEQAEQLIQRCCTKHKIPIIALRSGGRRRDVSNLRTHLALKLVNELGLSLAETGRQIGLTTSGVAQILRRNR